MPVKFEPEEEEDEVEVINSGSGNGSANKKNEIEEFDNMLFSKEYEAKRKKADELSKKTGELLLKGWAMLEDTCLGIILPISISQNIPYRLLIPIHEIQSWRSYLRWMRTCQQKEGRSSQET